MKNEEILKENNGKRFDIILSNPPYGSSSGDTLHLKFVDKILDIADKQISIFPFTFIYKVDHKSNNKYKEKWNDKFISVEEVSSKLFEGTGMPNCGIYIFDNNKKISNIKIKPLNKQEYNIKNLTEYDVFDKYEKNIINIIEKNNQQNGCTAFGQQISQSLINRKNLTKDQINARIEKSIKSCDPIKKHFNKYKNGAILICNHSNGGMNATFFSSKVGKIFTSYKDAYNWFKEVKPSYIILLFKSELEAKNCKAAMQRPLLRFGLYRKQDDQHMNYVKCYKYIPDIDWSDDRVKTDEGLLEVCGCPKDKCKEYAEYCKKIIDEVDKK